MLSYIHRTLTSRNQTRGFSLVETVVVVAILGVLVVVAIPVFGAIQANSRGATLMTATHNAASEITVAVTNKPGNRQVALDAVERLNGAQRDFAFTLAPEGNVSTNVYLKLPHDSTGLHTTVRPAPNTSTDTVYVYATDRSRNWAGAGTNGVDLRIPTWK